jgi:two-component system, OmpR family, response regulator
MLSIAAASVNENAFFVFLERPRKAGPGSDFHVIFCCMRLLVVEDNAKLAASLKKGLQQEGYAVDVAQNAADARTLLSVLKYDYDAVVLDRMLPDGDGLAMCRSLRSSRSSVPILMLTARDGVSERIDGLDAGADDYLTKPFSFEERTARIWALLRRPRGSVQMVLREGGVELDPGTREIRVAGKVIPVTAKEFGLLELLMRSPGQVFSREQITRSLWDQEFDAGSNVVEAHVKNVRRKLSEAGSNDRIETLRGTGYRFKR